jgi:hypothetical protein
MGHGSHKRGGLNLTIVVQDETWRKLGTFKWNSSDAKKQNYILNTISDAFGISFDKKTDMDWLK